MVTKNKNENHVNILEKTAEWGGLTAMVVATILSILELHANKTKEAVVLQPAYSYVTNAENETNRVDEMMRREKEETAHSVVSYGQTMRSHPITGKA